MLGQQPKLYHSVHEYLQILAHPSAYYAGHLEVAAANHLYGVNVIYNKVAGSPLTAIPLQNSNELATNIYALYYPSFKSALRHSYICLSHATLKEHHDLPCNAPFIL